MTFGFEPSVSLAENPAPVCVFCSSAISGGGGAPKMDLHGLRALLGLATEGTNKLGMCKKNKDRLDACLIRRNAGQHPSKNGRMSS